MDDQIGKPVTAFQVAEVEPGQLVTVQRIPHHHRIRHHPERSGLVQKSIVIEDPGAVWGELDARADLTEARTAFQHSNPQARAAQGVRRAQPADATADDDHVGCLVNSIVHTVRLNPIRRAEREILLCRT